MPDDEDIPVAAIAVEEPAPAPVVAAPVSRRPNGFVRLWRQIGVGSLTLSLLLHAGILLFMASYFIVRQMTPKQVDFLPGGDFKLRGAFTKSLVCCQDRPMPTVRTPRCCRHRRWRQTPLPRGLRKSDAAYAEL